MATAAVQKGSLPVLSASIQEYFPDGLGQNGGRIATDRIGLLRPTPASMPIEELRHRLKEDGYLFVKGLIPREDVMDAREKYAHCSVTIKGHLINAPISSSYFSQYSATSLLEPGSSPREGIFNSSDNPDSHKGIGGQGLPTDDAEAKILLDAHRESKYRSFVEHPALTGFIRDFMGWKEHQILDRTMLRHNVPFGLGTGIHYDKLFLRGGEGFFLTAWVPIGEIPAFNPNYQQ